MITRKLSAIVMDKLFRKKAIIILGARQVGKTTLLKAVAKQYSGNVKWFNCDEPDVRDRLTGATSTLLRSLIGNSKLVIIDEAQRIENIGLSLKLIIDQFPDIQVLASGSSSLELANKINEPLTGRKWEYRLFPISYEEMVDYSSQQDERRLLEQRIIFGYYPEVVMNPGIEPELLNTLCESYLYRDVLAYQEVRKPVVLDKLLQALALQLGSEVTFHEIGQLIGLDPTTVERYIDLLEKSFVLFRLPSLSRNLRNEIKKGRKVYFYDTGLRNAIIKNFNPLNLRMDTGALWENYCVIERMKHLHYHHKFVNRFFWRTHSQQEIDYIEESSGRLLAFEFKWNPKKKTSTPKTFQRGYPNSLYQIITPENFNDFLLT